MGPYIAKPITSSQFVEMIEHIHSWWFLTNGNKSLLSHNTTQSSSQNFHVELSRIYTNMWTEQKQEKYQNIYTNGLWLYAINVTETKKETKLKEIYRSYYNIRSLSNYVWWDNSLFLMQPVLCYNSPYYSKTKRDT